MKKILEIRNFLATRFVRLILAGLKHRTQLRAGSLYHMDGLDFSDTFPLKLSSGFNVRACYVVGLLVIRVQHFTLAGPVARTAPPPHAKERSLLVSSIANSVFKASKTVYCKLSFCMSLF